MLTHEKSKELTGLTTLQIQTRIYSINEEISGLAFKKRKRNAQYVLLSCHYLNVIFRPTKCSLPDCQMEIFRLNDTVTIEILEQDPQTNGEALGVVQV